MNDVAIVAHDASGIVYAGGKRSWRAWIVEYFERLSIRQESMIDPSSIVEIGSHHLTGVIDAVEPHYGAAGKVDGNEELPCGEKSVLDVAHRVEIAADHMAKIVDVKDECARVCRQVHSFFQERSCSAELNDTVQGIGAIGKGSDSHALIVDPIELGSARRIGVRMLEETEFIAAPDVGLPPGALVVYDPTDDFARIIDSAGKAYPRK